MCVILASLDLSAACDTVGHSTFVYRRKNLYCVSNILLRWFTYYLANRSHKVCVYDYDYDYEIDLFGHIIKKHNKGHKQ